MQKSAFSCISYAFLTANVFAILSRFAKLGFDMRGSIFIFYVSYHQGFQISVLWAMIVQWEMCHCYHPTFRDWRWREVLQCCWLFLSLRSSVRSKHLTTMVTRISRHSYSWAVSSLLSFSSFYIIVGWRSDLSINLIGVVSMN